VNGAACISKRNSSSSCLHKWHFVASDVRICKIITGQCFLTVQRCSHFLSVTFLRSTGLQHLHAQNILHRDLKPQNILLNKRKNMVKLSGGHFLTFHSSSSPCSSCRFWPQQNDDFECKSEDTIGHAIIFGAGGGTRQVANVFLESSLNLSTFALK
jgi:hypothetical protein